MVFTSGSTGLPKGAMLSAYNILSAACSNAESLLLTKEDRACLILPMFHIFGLVAGLFANAVADAEMIIPENLYTGAMIRTVYENRCTVMHAVPTFFSCDPENYSRSRVYKSLAAKLAEYKLPDKFIVFDAFPTLPNGKTDSVRLKNEVIEKCKK